MKKLLAISASVAGLLAFSSPAHATITFCDGPANTCGGQGETVHLDGTDTGSDNVVNGTLMNGTIGVLITGQENITVDANGGGLGQAWVVPVDGLFNALDFRLQSGFAFTHIEFDLNAPTNHGPQPDWVVTLFGYDASNTQFSQTFTANNNEFFNATASGGEVITHVNFTSASDLIGVGHIRIDGAGAVPEPATWALMILGFGGAGAMLRRRRAALA
jgi:hypothetical protein